jgi:hypothetical protein
VPESGAGATMRTIVVLIAIPITLVGLFQLLPDALPGWLPWSILALAACGAIVALATSRWPFAVQIIAGIGYFVVSVPAIFYFTLMIGCMRGYCV